MIDGLAALGWTLALVFFLWWLEQRGAISIWKKSERVWREQYFDLQKKIGTLFVPWQQRVTELLDRLEAADLLSDEEQMSLGRGKARHGTD